MTKKMQRSLKTAVRLAQREVKGIDLYNRHAHYRLRDTLETVRDKGFVIGATKQYAEEVRKELVEARIRMSAGYADYCARLRGLAELLGVD